MACLAVLAGRRGRDTLAAFIVLLAIWANLVVLKEITLFGLNATASDIFTVGGVFAMNIFIEHYGKEAALRLVISLLGLMLMIGLSTQVVLGYIPSPTDTMHGVYRELFDASPRIFIGSCIVYFISQQVNVRLYTFLRTRLPNLSLYVTTQLSLSISQLVDTICFSFIALYGLVSHIGQIILISYAIKFITISCIAPFASFVHRGREQ